MNPHKIIVIGGTGFLGYHVVEEFIAKGWEVSALGLPGPGTSDLFSNQVSVVLRDLYSSSDEELISIFKGSDALVFASGLDDRYVPAKPCYPIFFQANVVTPIRVLNLARVAEIKKAVVLGSYFTHFNRIWPEMRLAERHPYIRSRVEQEKAVTSVPGIETCVLELPYIFGSLPIKGWKPLWTPLIQYINKTPIVFYTPGGSACISAKTVGKAVYGAVANGKTGNSYPVGGDNLSWEELLLRLAAANGRKIQVHTVPHWLTQSGLAGVGIIHSFLRKESGLKPKYFAFLQERYTYIDPAPSKEALGFEICDLEEALVSTVLSAR